MGWYEERLVELAAREPAGSRAYYRRLAAGEEPEPVRERQAPVAIVAPAAVPGITPPVAPGHHRNGIPDPAIEAVAPAPPRLSPATVAARARIAACPHRADPCRTCRGEQATCGAGGTHPGKRVGMAVCLACLAAGGPPRVRSEAEAMGLVGVVPSLAGPVHVAFAGPCAMAIGGTETFHRTLLPRLDARIHVVGYAALDARSVAPADHGFPCPVGAGVEAVRALARACDVLVLWGIARPAELVPARGDTDRPAVVLVAHGDRHSTWTRSVMARAEPDVDQYVAVAPAALAAIPAGRRPGTSVIWNGVDPARVRPGADPEALRAAWGAGPLDVVLGCVSRFSREKRLDRAIEAMKLLPARFRLVLAGDGPEAARLRQRAEPLGGRVRFLGPVADVGGVLAGLDALLSPSQTEGFGLSIAEALAAGVPVVATPRGILETEPALARLVAAGAGARAWAEAVQADEADREGTQARIERARAFVREMCGVEGFARGWSDLLVEVAESSSVAMT